MLLTAFSAAGLLKMYVPFDVSEPMLRSASAGILKGFPHIMIHGVVGDFHRHLENVPSDGRRMFVILGGAVGTVKTALRRSYFARLRNMMRPGDSLLLGADIAKESARHIARYGNPIASELNLILLKVTNAELDDDFAVEKFRHVVEWDEESQEILYRIRSLATQQVHLRKVGMSVTFDEGEDMHTLTSAKFR